MIRYALKCSNAHGFESWFASAEAFDTLMAQGHISCPVCGVTEVSKSLMAPGVQASRSKAIVPAEPTAQPPAAPEAALEAKLKELREHVESNSDYVGLKFASEARAMHEGEIPHRAIYGEAKAEEAKKLLEDGVPVAPLPFTPTRKTN